MTNTYRYKIDRIDETSVEIDVYLHRTYTDDYGVLADYVDEDGTRIGYTTVPRGSTGEAIRTAVEEITREYERVTNHLTTIGEETTV